MMKLPFRPSTLRFIVTRLLTMVVLFALVTGCLSEKLIYPIPGHDVMRDPPSPLQAHVTASKSQYWYLPPSSSSHEQTAITVWCHGNAENLGSLLRLGFFKKWQSAIGTPLIALDYPGYGNSEGSPSESANVQAVAEILTEIRNDRPEAKIILAGQSIGSGVAVKAASEHAVDGLMLISPFLSLKDAGLAHYPSCLVWWLQLFTGDRYPSKHLAPSIHCPTRIIHGLRDRVIPVNQGKNLLTQFEKGEGIWIENRGHNDIQGSPIFWESLKNFVLSVK